MAEEIGLFEVPSDAPDAGDFIDKGSASAARHISQAKIKPAAAQMRSIEEVPCLVIEIWSLFIVWDSEFVI